MKSLILIKVGGALITDKTRPFTPREDMMQSIAATIAQLVASNPGQGVILGNGAGSFGHFAAARYTPDTQTRIAPFGVCDIHQSVVQLNDMFVRNLLRAEVPAFSVSPGSCVVCTDGVPATSHFEALQTLLSRRMVPVVYGDIVPDSVRGGAILSTESIFSLIIDVIGAHYDSIKVIYVGDVPGVMDEKGTVIPVITSQALRKENGFIGKAMGFDVTGGMRHKVEAAVAMAAKVTYVSIVSGHDDSLLRAVRDEAVGTRIQV